MERRVVTTQIRIHGIQDQTGRRFIEDDSMSENYNQPPMRTLDEMSTSGMQKRKLEKLHFLPFIPVPFPDRN